MFYFWTREYFSDVPRTTNKIHVACFRPYGAILTRGGHVLSHIHTVSLQAMPELKNLTPQIKSTDRLHIRVQEGRINLLLHTHDK